MAACITVDPSQQHGYNSVQPVYASQQYTWLLSILDSSAFEKRLKLQHGQLLSISPARLFSAIPIVEPVG